MIIGKIEYINLLPFHVFLKKRLRAPTDKKAWMYHQGVPSVINRKFQKGKVEAAMVSSIVSQRYRCSDFGIVADKKVLSVLVCPGKTLPDQASDTSNILAKILKMQGEVVIGDRALQRRKKQKCQDLAKLWYENFGLPFVFARFCYRKKSKQYEKLTKAFLQSHVKIPTYIIRGHMKRSGLSFQEINDYLTLIRYNVGIREKRSLKKFLKLAKKIRK
ncbi:MqnA/MqnD/SBP family protein [Nitratiruptor sp. SB155-2]|uniref:MqnA/MqnD/SBP family protein n=1 Tax=Nitratiruptor sp. (strain SB155-2) TaxID=387092 RepID=UPI000158736F|nr:MqnA/MqnD/SBP family protein [Nitratiruptor sp. SB155-2]BAF70743.1 conserved hypothetical protein [Nitratiruptor sp. SB155-2]